MKPFIEEKTTTNPSLEWKIRRDRVLSCGYCRPHQFENAKNNPIKNWKEKRKTKFRIKKS